MVILWPGIAFSTLILANKATVGISLCYLPCEISLTPVREAWLLFSLGFSSPRTGSLAWLLEQGIKPQGRLKSQNHLGL